MKENNQKIQKKIWGIIIAVLSVCIIATAFFDYVNINLAGKIPILDKILEFAGISEEYLKISPSELISHTSSAQDILGELGIDRVEYSETCSISVSPLCFCGHFGSFWIF